MLRKGILPTFNAVSANQKATCDLIKGLTYHVVQLVLSDDGTASAGNALDINATLDTLIDLIRIKVNGSTKREHSGSELNYLNSINNPPGIQPYSAKSTGTAGTSDYKVYLPMYFAEPWRKGILNQQAPAWDIDGQAVESFQIEVGIKSGIVSPVLTGSYEFEPARKQLGAISKVQRHSFDAVGSAKDYPLERRNGYLQAIHLYPTVGGTSRFVQKARLKANGQDIHDLIDYQEQQGLLLGRNMSPDTSAVPIFSLVLDADDPLTSALPTGDLRELALRTEWNGSAAGNMVALIERAEAWND